MRDIAVTLTVLIGLVYTIRKPYWGILLWSWLGYMNPHRLCYGFAYSMPFSQITAIVTMISVLFSREPKRLPNNPIVFLLIIFIIWMGVTTIFAFEPVNAKEQYIKIIKIQLPILLTIMLFNTRQRIEQLLWVIVISLGYFGTKGGVFTLLTGGGFRVYGPPSSFVEENNALAVATLMVIPLMVYLRTTLSKKWQRQLMLFAMISMGFSVIGSQSRGAFLAILTVGGYYWLQSDRKMITAVPIVISVMVLLTLLPESWYERMNTIKTYDKDASAMGRIYAWKLAFNVANHNFFGGGLNLWGKTTYLEYMPEFNPVKDKAFVAHSIYFSVLGEHGWVGLVLFIVLFYLGWHQCNALIKQCNGKENVQWIAELAKMLKVGLLAYFSGGAFLSLSYFDLPWHFLAIIVVLREVANKTWQEKTGLDKKEVLSEDGQTEKIKISDQGFIH
jgi:probable O-glycosylation ligase (exosortase A-associated)